MADSQKSGSSWGCCLLKILGVIMGLALIVAIAVGIVVWRAGAWVADIAEPAPAVHAPLVISAGEKEDVQRVVAELDKAEKTNGVIDESVTPAVFNGVIETLLADEAAKDKDMKDDVVRVGFDGDHLSVDTTWKLQEKQGPPKYANIVATFDAEIVEGKINKLELVSLKSGGREAPTLIRWPISFMLWAIKESINNPNAQNPQNLKTAKEFEAFKLIKREGDRIHIIVDGSKFKKAKASVEADEDKADSTTDKKDSDKKDTDKKSDF
ncbi:MAG TPA: hypothetical protein VKX17_07675 [Planctomycetota bacterium]|nr:hypothetical protein [Planctomycetota bacterium]